MSRFTLSAPLAAALVALASCQSARPITPIDAAAPRRTWHVYEARHRDAAQLVNSARVELIQPEFRQALMIVGAQRNFVIVQSDREQLANLLAVLERYDVAQPAAPAQSAQ